MIHHVWLMNRAGICLLDREYTDLEINKQLFSGFLTALSYLADQFHRKIDSLNMGGDMTIYYELEQNLIIAIAVDKDDNEKEIRRKIKQIKEEFNLKYNDILIDWDGNISDFDPFVKDLDRILMLDWNFEYNMQIKTDKVEASKPRKTKLYVSQRGVDLFETIREKTKK